MTTKNVRWFAATLLAFAAACGGSQRRSAPPPAPAPEPVAVESEPAPIPAPEAEPIAQLDSCPIEAGVISVRSETTADGAALIFTRQGGTSETGGELKAQLTTLADAHNMALDKTGVAISDDQAEPAPNGGGASEVGTGSQVGNSVSRGTGTEGATGIESPAEEGSADDGRDETATAGTTTESDATLATGTGMRSDANARLDEIVTNVPARARVEDWEQGARIVFTPEPMNIEALRAELQEVAEDLNSRCGG